jgi:hypothetical protein
MSKKHSTAKNAIVVGFWMPVSHDLTAERKLARRGCCPLINPMIALRIATPTVITSGWLKKLQTSCMVKVPCSWGDFLSSAGFKHAVLEISMPPAATDAVD